MPGQTDARQPLATVRAIRASGVAVLIHEGDPAARGERRNGQFRNGVLSVIGRGLRIDGVEIVEIEPGLQPVEALRHGPFHFVPQAHVDGQLAGHFEIILEIDADVLVLNRVTIRGRRRHAASGNAEEHSSKLLAYRRRG